MRRFSPTTVGAIHGGNEEVGGNIRGQEGGHISETETICLEPLDLLKEDLIGNLTNYARDASRLIKAIFENPATTRHKENVDTIIIPTRLMGGWTFYCTSR
mgnify:CR=1 FL=1|jgi:hypothetical protein